MGKGDGSKDLEALIEVGLARGMSAVDAVLDSLDSMPTSSTRKARKSVKVAEREYRALARKAQSKRVGGRVAAIGGGVVTAGAAVSTLITTVAAGTPFPGLFVTVVGGAVTLWGVRSTRNAPVISLIEPVPLADPLRRSAMGFTEVNRFIAVRGHIAALARQVDAIHPDAARELLTADRDAAPAMNALVERLRILDELQRSMPASEPASAARQASAVVQQRITDGVVVYEQLATAATSLLATPGIVSTEGVLRPAIDGMRAYAYGITRAHEI